VTDDARYARYSPTGQMMNLSALTAAEEQLLAGLHGQIERGDNVLECLSLGGDPWMYIYRHDSGIYYARHFPGGAHGLLHKLTRKSDAHQRAQDYVERGYDAASLPAGQEVTTNNRTRLDVATLEAPRISGFEVQFGDCKIPDIKARTTKSLRATALTGRYARPLPDGILPVWFSPDGIRRRWLYHVPTIEAPTMSWDFLPRRNTVTAVGVRAIEEWKCTPGGRWPNCPRTGKNWCGQYHPGAVLRGGLTVDDVAAMVATAVLVPLRYFTGAVYLVDKAGQARYGELGGQGEFSGGSSSLSRTASLLGPCRNAGHVNAAPTPATAPPQRPILPQPALPDDPPPVTRASWLCVHCGAQPAVGLCPACRESMSAADMSSASGPCVRCKRPCSRYPDGRRRLCDECDHEAEEIIARALARSAHRKTH
jgi:hypothetical protein